MGRMEKRNSFTIMVEDFSNSVSLVDRICRQKISKEIEYLNNTVDNETSQTYRILHSKIALRYTFFFLNEEISYGTYARSQSEWIHLKSCKGLFQSQQKKLENSSRRKIGKSTDLWELNNTTHLKAN